MDKNLGHRFLKESRAYESKSPDARGMRCSGNRLIEVVVFVVSYTLLGSGAGLPGYRDAARKKLVKDRRCSAPKATHAGGVARWFWRLLHCRGHS